MQDPTRRTVVSGAAMAFAIHSSRSPILGANDRVNIAVVGVGGRGTNHVDEYLRLPGARLVAVVDVNQEAQERAQARVKKANNEDIKTYADMRRAYDDKGIDAVSIATPNHWHVLAAYWAVAAGKDVYVEKPVSHNIFEGRQLTAAARKYNRMVQVGQQSRSIPHKMKAMQLLQDGVIGKVYLAKGLCYKRRKSIGRQPDTPTPVGVNWELFLGPAPLRPFNANRFKYNWHWFWDTGNGDIGNQGVHEMDVAVWGLGKKAFPTSVYSSGGKFVYDDDQETPNTQIATFDYGDGTQVQFEVRGLISQEEGGLRVRGGNVVGDLFLGADGVMAVDGSGFQVWKGEDRKLVMDEKLERGQSETGRHMQNFLDAIKSRKYTDLHCDVEVGALSAAYCHLANISYRLTRKLNLDPKAGRVTGDDEAQRMFTRNYRAPYTVPERV